MSPLCNSQASFDIRNIYEKEGELGSIIIWNPFDFPPSSYLIMRNGSEVNSGAWNTTSEAISISVDKLYLGTWNYTIIVYDQGGNSVQATVFVKVIEASPTASTTTTTMTTTTTVSIPDMGTPLFVGALVGISVLIVVLMIRKHS